ncbi:hypothetical protein BLL42_01910 [Pseudomonas frederiksbergensis]|uniref:Uncharacterized protein n=1 Tax=Pseudomonas frederiksbergensis TaxID=104087 RepID=A0A1J0EFG6_9PSED|nr:hypothetical protein [Pseudomonas frederiksbergensis]APC14548.1 hypothetical protein BLL42_01910 [Pseudomonas frederiksbergensis]
MGQEFQGGVGQVAEGDINNYGININLPDKPEFRGLVTAQRKELHELRAKCEELGDDPRDVWRRVHAQLGVCSISEITAEQFHEARTVISGRLEQLQEEADKRRLMGKILRSTAEKDARQEMLNFCDLSFGRTQLSHLKRNELQRVLEFVQQVEINPQPAAEIPQVQTAEPLQLREFLLMYKTNAAGLFLFGIFVGRFWS